MSNSQIEPAEPIHDDRVGKLFLVMDQGTRKCLVCEELFTPQEAPQHSRVVCHPASGCKNEQSSLETE